jgi:hypothetical protein
MYIGTWVIPLILTILFFVGALRQTVLHLDDEWGGGASVFIWPVIGTTGIAGSWIGWALWL